MSCRWRDGRRSSCESGPGHTFSSASVNLEQRSRSFHRQQRCKWATNQQTVCVPSFTAHIQHWQAVVHLRSCDGALTCRKSWQAGGNTGGAKGADAGQVWREQEHRRETCKQKTQRNQTELWGTRHLTATSNTFLLDLISILVYLLKSWKFSAGLLQIRFI